MPEYQQDSGFDHHEFPSSSPLTVPTSRFTNRAGSSGQMTATTMTAPDSTASLAHAPSNGNTPQTPRVRSIGTYDHAKNNRQGDAVEGWPLLAKLMAEESDFEAFPRYPELNIKNLLYYQVELAAIKADLERHEKADRDLQPQMAEEDEHEFHMLPDKMIETETDQWDHVLRLRKCLNDYNNALLQYSQVAALPSPSRRNMKELVRWIVSPKAGNFKVKGRGSEAWGKLYEDAEAKPSLGRQFLDLLLSIVRTSSTPTTRPDLVAPRGRKSVDGMTRWIAEEFMPFWVNLTRRSKQQNTAADEEKSRQQNAIAAAQQEETMRAEELKDLKLDYITSYSGLTLLRFTSKLTTLFACMLPMAAIGILSRVEKLSDRLALIASFTAVFCAGLMMLTEITRVQVFTATSAFLAVLVVFVQQGP
ncbi:putative isoleucyl-tRNA synthetase [Cladorrhinum sp. PSN332]|nr:putative isoleucyl-tRNA synthetase [Cladorrhinum sp. PSN332]